MYTCNNPNASLGQATMSVPGFDTTYMNLGYLPGIVIFVHGVNSDGEWYEEAEKGLLQGLNTRMGLEQSLSPEAQLEPVTYAEELLPNGSSNRDIDGLNFITAFGRSPVIRFRWGFRAAGADGTEGSQDEVEVYGSKIYLNELEAWGGGPFQNGTTALPYMWGEGLDDRVFWWWYANMFPIDGREVYGSPPRAYYAHAAHRLKELIKAIRDKQADCPITVVCHSQGNMVTLGAALLGEAEGAIADTYVLCNPPYSLKSLGMDQLVFDDAKSASGEFGSVTGKARATTFKNFLHAVRQRACAGQSLASINIRHGFVRPGTGEQVFGLGAFPQDPNQVLPPGQDRDNRGRVFLYCNPHDQVIGCAPVQGIGWQGVSAQQLKDIEADGVFHQRVWAMASERQSPPFSVGAPAWTGRSYRYLDDHYDAHAFWHPQAPKMRFRLSFNEEQGPLSRFFTLVTAPLVWSATRILNFSINATPEKDWAVPINAPVLRAPHTPQAVRYGRLTPFDQEDDQASDALAGNDDERKPRDGAYGGAFDAPGLGNAASEAGLRREVTARLLRQKREAEKAHWTPTEEDERAAVKRMLQENPNATDHSTILTSADNVRNVLAYDVAIGWVDPYKITADDMLAFRQFAHWMMLNEAEVSLPVVKQFTEYKEQGWYANKQLQHTYTLLDMAAKAPGIKDERERHWAGPLKG